MSIPIERSEPAFTAAASRVTAEVFESFLQCETKSKLYSQGAAETNLEFKNWLRRERDRFKEDGSTLLRAMCQEDEFYNGTPSVEALKQKRWRIIANYVATSAWICAHLDALELTPATPNRIASFYRPLRFISSERLTAADRLLLAFDALAISHIIGKTPANGKIIHGSKYRTAVIPLSKLIARARTIVGKIVAHQPGVRCVGAPIRDTGRRVFAGLSVTGAARRITPPQFGDLAALIKHHANSISAQLGYRA